MEPSSAKSDARIEKKGGGNKEKRAEGGGSKNAGNEKESRYHR